MRKYYLITILSLSLISHLFSQENGFYQIESSQHLDLYEFSSVDEDYLIKTRTRQIWNENSSIWLNDSLVEYFYNDLNLLDTLLFHKWRNGTVWGNDGGRTYIYNQSNKILQIDYYSSSWYNNGRNRYIYNGNNLSRIILDFYSGGGLWYEAARSTYQWDYQNNLRMLMNEYRHQMYGWWCYGYMYEYMYDADNRLIRTIEHDGDYCFSWYLYKQKTYTYNANGNNNEYMGQIWNSADSIWINDFLYLYEYDNNNSLVRTIYQNWDADSLEWENVWRETYTYTPLNDLKTILKETWSSEFKWENYSFREIFYGDFNDWIEDVTQLWDSTGWTNYYRYLATWDEPVTVKNDDLKFTDYHLLQNYPNPFNPTTTIKYQIPELSFVTLRVFDVLGNEMATLVNEEKPAGEYEIDFSTKGGSASGGDTYDLPSGIYFYRIQAGNFSETKKMVLLK